MSRLETALERRNGQELPQRDIFCEIVDRKSPSVRIFETDTALVVMDLNGYPLVLAKDHLEESIPKILELAGRMIDPVRKAYHADGIRILFNQGESAGQEIIHPHVHVMPREEVQGGVGRTITIKDLLEKERMAKKVRELSHGLYPHINRKKS